MEGDRNVITNINREQGKLVNSLLIFLLLRLVPEKVWERPTRTAVQLIDETRLFFSSWLRIGLPPKEKEKTRKKEAGFLFSLQIRLS